ncbi:ferric-chelate reductase [Xylariaceae sp. FL0016]|nr:ferric-chelate reductase [Xylariaceae sp. FL0016]
MLAVVMTLLVSMVFSTIVTAAGPIPVSRSGLAGIDGFTFYDPFCAHGCFRSFSGYMLTCSDLISPGGHSTGAAKAHDLSLCRASNFPYLSSIAWCIHSYCPNDTRASKIEHFWETQITGDVHVTPQWSYGEVLASIRSPPTTMATDQDTVLNTTTITERDHWVSQWITLYYFFRETALESDFGLAICLTQFGLPIILTWLGYLPFISGFLERMKPWLYRSAFRTHHDISLPLPLGKLPTAGQSLYIAAVVILNIVFLGIGYRTAYPGQTFAWYENRYQELMAYFMWRTGVLAFCNMPVLFLFSSRNNLLLWLTNWSYSTYLLLHRWIARLVLLQTLLHSIIALVLYQNTGSYASSLSTSWWIWGCVAAVTAVIVVLTSVFVLRQRAYELFLITHIVMAIICVVGCWYHVNIGYENCFGYETWLYATMAVWFFDRVARVARIKRAGRLRSRITDVSSTIVRVDIHGCRWATPGRHVYIYFPTLNPLRPWESHPFSVVPTAMLAKPSCSDPTALRDNKEGKMASNDTPVNALYNNSGLTLFVRKNGGMTDLLQPTDSLLTLVEGPFPTNPTKAILQSDRVLLIGGGIGITGLLPLLRSHANVKLFYSVKAADRYLMDSLCSVLDGVQEKQILIGQRLDTGALLRDEVSMGWSQIGVVVCGPPSMCDDVRDEVARLGRDKSVNCKLKLRVDSFSW